MDTVLDDADVEETTDDDTASKEKSSEEEADFETAVKACGFGKFNIFLMATVIPCACSQVFETHNMSYVLPVAQCDLALTLKDKGLLNSVSFAGMIASGFFWGFLSDKFGRRKVMLYGYFLHWCSMITSFLAQNFSMLMVAKFFGGSIVNGPTSAVISLLTEFHVSKHRAKIHLVRGMMMTIATMILPLLSWLILPTGYDFILFGYFRIYSWNLFLLICSLAPLIAGILLSFTPESPKFFMTAGKNDCALKVFKRIYRMNTGKAEETFPVRQLVDEKKNNTKSVEASKPKSGSGCMSSFNVFSCVKPLFFPPHILRLILTCINALVVLMSMNTLRFWQPQLLQAVNDYKYMNNGSSASMCVMLKLIVPTNKTTTCTVNLDNASVYINSVIISSCQLVTFLLAGTLVGLLGKKTIMISGAIIAGVCALMVYFAQNSETLVALFSIFSSTTALCGNVGATITLEMFPTTFRTTAISLHMMIARIGSLIGNNVFPLLLHAGCLPPFLFISLTIFSSAFLAVFFPNTENKPLQ